MRTFGYLEGRIKEQEEKIRECRTKIKCLENLGVKRELTERECLLLMNLRLTLDRDIARLRETLRSANSDYNLDAYSRSCPVPMEDDYYERKLKAEGYIVCIKF